MRIDEPPSWSAAGIEANDSEACDHAIHEGDTSSEALASARSDINTSKRELIAREARRSSGDDRPSAM